MTEYTEEQEAFCNANCYWMEHHPDCVRFIDGIDDCPHGVDDGGCKECYEKEAREIMLQKIAAIGQLQDKAWVKLTDLEISEAHYKCKTHFLFAREIERILMEKNR